MDPFMDIFGPVLTGFNIEDEIKASIVSIEKLLAKRQYSHLSTVRERLKLIKHNLNLTVSCSKDKANEIKQWSLNSLYHLERLLGVR